MKIRNVLLALFCAITACNAAPQEVTNSTSSALVEDYGAVSGVHTGYDSFAVGEGSSATGDRSVAIGYRASATNSYSMAYGAYCSSTSAGTLAAGEFSSASAPNAVAIGYANTATGVYSLAIGSYVHAYGPGSLALGHGAAANLPGEIAISSSPSGPGQHRALSMYSVHTTSPTILKCTGGVDFLLSPYALMSMRLNILASTTGRTKVANEEKQLTISSGAGNLVIEGQQSTYMPAGKTLADAGWSWNIATNATQLQVTVDPGSDNVTFFVQVEWDDMGGLQ